jgi:predicted transcriptional regulator
MTAKIKCRHQLYLSTDISAKLEVLAAKPGASKSAILADAVKAWLARRGTHELDDRFGLRLERISGQLGRIERDQQVLLESLALFIRYQLTINAPLPEPDQATRAVGRDRFQSFIDQVGRQIAAGNRTLGRAEASDRPANTAKPNGQGEGRRNTRGTGEP